MDYDEDYKKANIEDYITPREFLCEVDNRSFCRGKIPMCDASLVSIVIPTRNAAPTLEACLRSIRSQSYQNVEVIIVDNYSSDETRNIARAFKSRIIVGGPKPPNNDFFTAPIQRRIGADHVSGDFIFFVDADMILEEKLLEDCVKRCLSGADAIMIPEVSFGEGFWTRCKIVERRCYFDSPFKDEAIQAARFIKRSAYESVGGWNPRVGGLDDWDITTRLRTRGFKIVRSDSRIFHNEGHLTSRRIIVKKYNIGKGGARAPSLYVSSGGRTFRDIAIQLTPLRILILLMRLPKFNKDLFVLVGVPLMKTVELISVALGFITSRLRQNDMLDQTGRNALPS